MLDRLFHQMSHTGRALAATVLATSALLSPPLSCQEATPRTGATQQRQAGQFAPATSSIWIRAHGIGRLRTMLAEHPLQFAWLAATENDAPLTRALRDITQAVQDVAIQHGLDPKLFDALVAREVEISVQTDQSGKTSFVLILDAGEHESLVQDFVDELESAEQGVSTRRLAHPFGLTSEAFVDFAGTRLLVSDNLAALRTSIDLVARGKGKSLASDPTFVAAGLRESSNAWLQAFVRSSQPWLFDALTSAGVAPQFFASQLRTKTRALAFESDPESGYLVDRLRIVRSDDTALAFLTKKGPDPRLARMIPQDSTAWTAIAYEPTAMIATLRLEKAELPGLGRLEVLDADLVGALEGRGLTALAAALSPSLLRLAPDPRHEDLEGYVLMVEDSRLLRETLEAIATPRKKPGSTERSIHRYAIERGGQTLYATLIDDMMLVATSEARESALLERALSGEAAPSISQKFAANEDRFWLLGAESAALRHAAADPLDETGLRASSKHFDTTTVRGSLEDGVVVLEGRSTTGFAHIAALVLAGTIPQWFDGLSAERERWALGIADQILDATRRFVAEATLDNDRDGLGEPIAISGLRDANLLESKELRDSKGEIVDTRGYRVMLIHPTEVDAREQHWGVLAWPARPGISGTRCWFVRNDGSAWVSTRLTDLDASSGPTTSQIFGELVWQDQPDSNWVQSREARDEIATAPPAMRPVDTETKEDAGVTTTPSAKTDPVTTTETPTPVPTRTEADDRRRADEARRLEVAGTKQDVDALVPFLSHDDPAFRARAAWFCGRMAARSAIPQIAGILHEDDNVLARRAAAQALAQMRDQKSRATLTRSLGDADGKVRLLAATGLLGSKDPATMNAIVDAIIGFPGDVHGDRTQAILAIADSGNPKLLDALVGIRSTTPSTTEAVLFCFQKLSPKLDAAAETKVLTQALESPITSLREHAIRRIAEAGYASARPALESRLATEEKTLRPLLETAIASLTEKPTVDWIGMAKAKGKALLGKLEAQPKEIQLAIALTPLVLLILLVIVRHRRRRAARKASSVDHLVGPSNAHGPTPSLRNSAIPGLDESSIDDHVEEPAGWRND